MTQNLWDAAKSVLRGKFIAIQAYLQKQQPPKINNLTLHLKPLEKEQKTLKLAEGTKIIKFRAEIKEKEMKETIANSNKKKSWFFKKINKIDQLLARLLKKRKKGKESNQ